MEDELKMLFRLSQPEGVRNLNAEEMGCSFWSELGLENFSGLKNNLDLDSSTTGETCHVHGNHLTALYLINALRLSEDCPFLTVRQTAAKALQYFKEKGISVPVTVYSCPSTFIEASEFPRSSVEGSIETLYNSVPESDDGTGEGAVVANLITEPDIQFQDFSPPAPLSIEDNRVSNNNLIFISNNFKLAITLNSAFYKKKQRTTHEIVS